jgi:hydroxymethylbilane synthase
MALAQVDRVSAELTAIDPRVDVEVIPMTTSGDRWAGPLSQLGGKGAFTKEVDAALLDGRCDLCVHCVKDIPGDQDLPEGTEIVAYLARDDVRDAVVQPGGLTLSQLPDGSRVGTSSPRRAAQLALHWPRLRAVPIRGNANTRLAKLDAGEFDALLLAVSGLERIDLTERITEILDVDSMLPAVGSGTLALQCRGSDEATKALVAQLNDPATFRQTTAERTMLRTLSGHCHSPIAGYATAEPDGRLSLHGLVMSADGATVLDARYSHEDPEVLGTSVAAELLRQGARQLIDECDER